MKKRLFGILLCICMVFSLLPISALATGEPATNVAKIGDTSYATLAEAVAAAKDGNIITLLRDINIVAGPMNNIIIDKGITIDGNGKTISRSFDSVTGSDGYGNYEAFFVVSSPAVTIKNVIFKALTDAMKDEAAIYVKANGTSDAKITFKDNTFDGNSESGLTGIISAGNTGAYLTVAGNTFIGLKYAGYFNGITNGVVSGNTVTGSSYNAFNIPGSAGSVTFTDNALTGIASADDGNTYGDTYNSGIYVGTGNVVVIESGSIAMHQAGDKAVYAEGESLTITGGTFSTDPSAYVAVGYRATLSGSTYTVAKLPENKIVSVSATVWKDEVQDTTAQAIATVSDGIITVSGKLPAEDNKVIVTYTCTDGKTGTITITLAENGITANPDKVTVGGTTYTVDVAGLTKLPATVKVVPPAAEPVPSPILPGTASQEDKAAASDAYTAINAGIPSDGEVQPSGAPAPVADGLAAAVADTAIKSVPGATTKVQTAPNVTKPVGEVINEASENIDTASDSTPQALKDIATNSNENPAVVVVIPVMEIKVTNAKVEEGKTSITLDISAFSQAVVTTKNIAANEIKTEAGTDKNAVKVGDKVPVTVDTPVTISIPIPNALTGELYVKHTHNDVTETVPATINQIEGHTYRTATFTVSGLSEMTIYSDSRSCTVNYSDGTSETITPDKTGSAGGYQMHAAAAPAGKYFVGWQFDNAGYTGTYTHFTDQMLTALGSGASGGTVNATAVFADIPVSSGDQSYTLSFDVNGGSKLDSITKSAGTVIDLATYKTTREGFNFGGWYSDKELTKIITSVTLSANTTVYAKWTKVLPFTDVPNDAYYKNAVDWAVEKGVTDGTTPTTFSPDAVCTRGQAVTFLWRAMGSPKPTSAKNPFTDIKADAYYYEAVLWAVEKGITDGMTPTTFEPETTVNRGQAVTFIHRAAGTPTAVHKDVFTDVAEGAYYHNAVLWAVSKSITDGMTPSTFAPNGGCTRGQIVTFLYRWQVTK